MDVERRVVKLEQTMYRAIFRFIHGWLFVFAKSKPIQSVVLLPLF